MSRSLNRVTLIGHVGNDPDVRTTANGGRVAAFSLATSRVWTGADGAKQEKTEWHRCVGWNSGNYKLADIIADYVSKGGKLYAEGEIEYRRYQDKDGVDRTVTEIKLRELLLLGGKREGDASEKPMSKSAPTRAPAKASSARTDDFSDFPGALEDEDDDLPF